MQDLPLSSVFADKATNPLNKETDWANINSFCDQLNNEPDGWEFFIFMHTDIKEMTFANNAADLLGLFAPSVSDMLGVLFVPFFFFCLSKCAV